LPETELEVREVGSVRGRESDVEKGDARRRRRASDGLVHQRQYSTRTLYAKGAYAAHVPAGGKALALCLLNNILGSTSRLDAGRARNPSRGSAGVIARLLTFAALRLPINRRALN